MIDKTKLKSNLRPSVIPVACIVCNKRGRVNWDKEPCKACDEKGYILVPPMKEVTK